MHKKCPYLELFWSVFSGIQTEYERYSVSLRIQSECGKIRTRITPNTDDFHAVDINIRIRFPEVSTHFDMKSDNMTIGRKKDFILQK